jgi:hypothetical protein
MTNKNTATIFAGACLAALIATSAHAAGGKAPDPAPGTTPDGVVIPPENMVLPNAPKVGDTAPRKDTPASTAGSEGSPDWPCVQRKVLTITPAQIWDGPSIDGLKGWEDDQKIVDLTNYLESRRIPLEDAEKALKEYAESLPEAERDQKLTLLFASLLDKINRDRQFVLGRVEDFQRRQKARADELEQEGQQLASLNQEIPAVEQLGPRDTTLTTEQQEYNWNARIFQERQENLTMACEIPVLIEQRAYEVARLIRAQMSE